MSVIRTVTSIHVSYADERDCPSFGFDFSMSWNKPEKGKLVGETSIEDRIEVGMNADMTGWLAE